jgi:sugar lactone lactonase YvrE
MTLMLTLLVLLITSLAVPAFAAPGGSFPKILPLPDGFRPEGIASGRGTTFYVGSLADGAIYAGDLRTGQGAVLASGQPGRAIAGMTVDARSNYLFAAGTQSGQAYVFDAATGAQLATYQLATSFPSFVNDVIVTRDAAYFTDSFQALLYRLPLGPGGALPGPTAVQALPLSGDWMQVPGPFVFNANGIEATADGRWLIVVNSNLGRLYRVDPQTGAATAIDLGGASMSNGDGIRLEGQTLYVVRNLLNQIEEVRLNRDLSAGAVVRTITDPAFRVPTTVAKFGSSLYAVNARFGTTPTPTTEYEAVQVPKN